MNKPIHVIALAEALPAHLPEVLARITELIELSRQEEGCLRYDLYADKAQPERLNTIEIWESQAALDRHLSSAHVMRILTSLIGKMAGLPQIRVLNPVNELET